MLLDQWTTVVDGFAARLDAVTGAQWDVPSTCSEWNVRALVEHAIGAQQMVSSQLGGGVDTAGMDPKGAFAAVIAAAKAAYEVPGNLEKTVESPFGPVPAAQAMGLPTTDLLVHTWDLARSIGADEKLNEEAVATAFERLKPLDAMIRQPGVFGAKIEAPAGADLQTQFLCFLGRKV